MPGDIDFYIVRENTEGEYTSLGGIMYPGTERVKRKDHIMAAWDVGDSSGGDARPRTVQSVRQRTDARPRPCSLLGNISATAGG